MSCADHLPPVDLRRISAASILSGEHQVILQVLAVVERLAADAERDRRIAVDDARQAIEVLRLFADRCHHGKEERCLFPALERAQPGFGPLAVMLAEHDEGRSCIAAMVAAVDAGAAAGFAGAARAYVALLREHIRKEDDILFRFAGAMLSLAEDAAVVEAYRAVEHGDMGDGTHERLLGIADRLAAAYGVPRASDDPRIMALLTAVCGCAAAAARR